MLAAFAVAASLYFGTTATGGAHGAGTVFEADGGKIVTLYDFCAAANCTDGAGPVSVVEMQDGALMGTTAAGGGYVEGYPAAGTVFRLVFRRGRWVEDAWGLCFYWRDCDHYGTPSGELVAVTPNTIEAMSQARNGRRVLWTFEVLAHHKSVLTPLRWWR